MMLALLAAFQLAGPSIPPASVDSLPRISLAEAIQRSSRLDPSYVAAVGQIDNAEWGRRAAFLAFILPSVTATGDYTISSTPSFNFGTNQLSKTSVTARLDARYELFTGGRKLADYAQNRALLEGAEAGELKARFLSAFRTESAYYAVLSTRELTETARARVRRAEEQLRVARARVVSGAAVQSDSLQVLLELTRARVDQLQLESQLRVARLELGRLVGEAGALDAEPLPAATPAELPIALSEAVLAAVNQGPDYRAARANERAAAAALRARRGAYLPLVALTASTAAFDTKVFPDAAKRSTFSINISIPLWNNGQRELALTQARVSRDVARVVREDLERGALRDVTESYDAYQTARATVALSAEGLAVAQENYRVQDARYRAGASTILDLLGAQVGLTQAEADLVQARYATQLALAGLEVILGRRLFSQKESQ